MKDIFRMFSYIIGRFIKGSIRVIVADTLQTTSWLFSIFYNLFHQLPTCKSLLPLFLLRSFSIKYEIPGISYSIACTRATGPPPPLTCTCPKQQRSLPSLHALLWQHSTIPPSLHTLAPHSSTYFLAYLYCTTSLHSSCPKPCLPACESPRTFNFLLAFPMTLFVGQVS